MPPSITSKPQMASCTQNRIVRRVWIVEQGTWRSEQWVSFTESVWRTKAEAFRHCRADGFKYDASSGFFYRGEERTRRFVECHKIETENAGGHAPSEAR